MDDEATMAYEIEDGAGERMLERVQDGQAFVSGIIACDDERLPKPLPMTTLIRTLVLYSARQARPALNLLPLYRLLDRFLFNRLEGLESILGGLFPIKALVVLALRNGGKRRAGTTHPGQRQLKVDRRYWLLANMGSLCLSLGSMAAVKKLYERQRTLLTVFLANAYPAWRSIKAVQELMETLSTAGKADLKTTQVHQLISPLRHWLTYWFLYAHWTMIDVARATRQQDGMSLSGTAGQGALKLALLVWLQSGEPVQRPSEAHIAPNSDAGGSSFVWEWLIGPLMNDEPSTSFSVDHHKIRDKPESNSRPHTAPQADARHGSHVKDSYSGHEHPEEREGLPADFRALDSVWMHQHGEARRASRGGH